MDNGHDLRVLQMERKVFIYPLDYWLNGHWQTKPSNGSGHVQMYTLTCFFRSKLLDGPHARAEDTSEWQWEWIRIGTEMSPGVRMDTQNDACPIPIILIWYGPYDHSISPVSSFLYGGLSGLGLDFYLGLTISPTLSDLILSCCCHCQLGLKLKFLKVLKVHTPDSAH